MRLVPILSLLTALVPCLASADSAWQTEPTRRLRVSQAARAVAPGEVVRLEITAPVPIETLRVRAFDRAIATTRQDDVWRVLIGIDLEVSPGGYLVWLDATLADGTEVSQSETLTVEPKEFPTRQLRVAPRFVNPPAAVQPRIDRERRRLTELFASVEPSAGWRGPFLRPIEVSVISGFGVRSVYNGEARAPHGGADFASPQGTAVRAPGGGVVVLAESLYYTGDTVMVDHGLGLVSLFAHLSRIDVKVGRTVIAGQRIGLVGATGRVTGPHLHWTVRLQGARVDPLSVMAALDTGQP